MTGLLRCDEAWTRTKSIPAGLRRVGVLVPAIRRGDIPGMDETGKPANRNGSFEREALPHLDVLYRVALRLARDPDRAADLVQETMLRAHRAWASFRTGTNARAWLITILRNQFISDYRRERREAVVADLDKVEPFLLDRSTPDADPEGEFFSQIVDKTVLEAVDALTSDFREVLVLSDMEGMSYAEIAATLEIPVGTVKSRLFRARRQLQEKLYNHAVEMGYIRPRQES